MRQVALWFGCWWLLVGCVERITLDESLSGESLLVVDGVITNADGPSVLQLSYTSGSLKTYEGNPVTGADVYITDEEGVRSDLEEINPLLGEYQTDSSSFRGVVGKTYTLHIVTPDGRTYASSPETMREVADIDSIYYKLESRPVFTSLGDVRDEWGVQFYLNTGGDGSATSYYQWKWIDTYQFSAPFPASTTDPAVATCFQSTTSARTLTIGSSQGLSRDRVEGQKLNFVLKSGRTFQARYSLLVQQLSLSEQAHTFWENVQQQRTMAGSVFAPPPAPIAGNMYNANDEQEVVLGYFQVSAVAERRIFVRRSEVPEGPGGSPGGFEECYGSDSVPDYCYDCSLMPGTTTTVPSFW